MLTSRLASMLTLPRSVGDVCGATAVKSRPAGSATLSAAADRGADLLLLVFHAHLARCIGRVLAARGDHRLQGQVAPGFEGDGAACRVVADVGGHQRGVAAALDVDLAARAARGPPPAYVAVGHAVLRLQHHTHMVAIVNSVNEWFLP